MAWNIVRIDHLLLGQSVTSKEEADKWAKYYTEKYAKKFGTFVTVDCGNVIQTCDIPKLGGRK